MSDLRTKPSGRTRALLLGACLILLAAVAVRRWRPSSASVAAIPAVAATPERRAEAPGNIGCLGRFVPEDGVIRVAAPYYQSRPSVVAQLDVREGQWVQHGQLIAYLDGKPQVEAERARAAAQVDFARMQAAQSRTGAKDSEVNAQRSEVARLDARRRLLQSELERSEKLARNQDISAADLETRRAAFEMAGQEADAARGRLAAMGEVRGEDVRVADAAVEVAVRQLAEIEARLAALTVRAPASGWVIKLHAHEGEQAGADGIIELADTNRMAVDAEVYATDIARVHAGQPAVIEIEGGGPKLSGKVTRVGERVQQAAVMPGDPTSYSDAHVVPVRIRVDGCARGACPINSRVKVTIGGPQ